MSCFFFLSRSVTTINEVLLAIRAVKFHAWEVLFADRISSNRQEELVTMTTNNSNQTIQIQIRLFHLGF
jgi:hypothetical protein